ncbi:MAG: hypothetical protein KBC84_07435 [Proteobacteria bacterium]|nr:hypothetical protein [Pseudomonadota bacterium]
MLKKLLIIVGIFAGLYVAFYSISALGLLPPRADKYFPFSPNSGSTIHVALQGYLYNAARPDGEFNLYFTSQEEMLTNCTVAIDGQAVNVARVRFNTPYYNDYLNQVAIKMNDRFSLGQNYDESSYGIPAGLPQQVKLQCLQGYIDWNTNSFLGNGQAIPH